MCRLLTVVALASSVVVHSAQTPMFERGATVRVRSDATVPARPTEQRLLIVGVPGDRIRGDSARVLINGSPLTGFSGEFVQRVAAGLRQEVVVPAGHYYVMGEQRTNNDIQEYWGQHHAASLEPAVK